MSTAMRKGLIVGLIHLALVASLRAKLLIDRATRPRVWARTVPVDPDSPLRGRYVRLGIQVQRRPGLNDQDRVKLVVKGDSLVAEAGTSGSAGVIRATRDEAIVVLDPALAFFIPEHVPDPSIRPPGEELWVEVTIPHSGAPRPIRLGVKKDGVITPLDLN